MEEQDQAVKEIEPTYFLPDICSMCTFQSFIQLDARNSLIFILVIYPIELEMKLEENLSFARKSPWKVSGQYRVYLGCPERFGHFVGIKLGCFLLLKHYLSKGLLLIDSSRYILQTII